jgi:two-component system, chemotaxis family, response regulator Rcp1
MDRDIIHVLLVEDSIADSTLILEVFQDEKIAVDVSVVRDGIEAMDYLTRQGQYTNATTPDIVILDLNLPRMDGREVLAEMKKTTGLDAIPVVILTTSQAEEDIVASYKLRASCYVKKPIDLEQFIKIVKSIDSFWFTAVHYPPKR